MGKSLLSRITFWISLLLCICACTGAQSTHGCDFQKNRVDLDFKSRESASQALEMLDSLPDSIDVIAVKGYGSLINITKLDCALKGLAILPEEFHFEMNIPIPRSTLNIIEEASNTTRLYYQMPFTYWDSYSRDVPNVQGSGEEPFRAERSSLRKAILNSKSLFSLGAKVVYGSQENYEDLPLVHNILKTCPNIRELDLSIRHQGCIISNYAEAFDFTNVSQLPPLDRLKLSGYRFYHYPNGEMYQYTGYGNWDRMLHWLNPWATPVSGTPATEPHNLDVWMAQMDWSQLTHLDLDHADAAILDRLSSQLSSLDYLVIDYGNKNTSVHIPGFLWNLTKSLESLTLNDFEFPDYDGVLAAIATSQPNLKSLTLTENESLRHRYCHVHHLPELCPIWNGVYYLPRPYVNSTQLLRLAKSNPDITRLTIDAPRAIPNLTDRATWSIDWKAVEAAACHPNLTHLSLHIESPDHTLVRYGRRSDMPGSYRRLEEEPELPKFQEDPSFSRTYFPQIFEWVNEQRRSRNISSLQELEIQVGRFDEKGDDWGMMGEPDLLVGQWVCQDDEGEVKCFGGNAALDGYGDCRVREPYSEDWTLPDPGCRGDDLWWEHSEL